MKKTLFIFLILFSIITITGCSNPNENSEDLVKELGLTADSKEATEHTALVNSAIYSLLDFTDTSEYDNATFGLIDAPEQLELKDENGKVVWSQKAYSFLNDYEKAPDSVNPSLWENTKNNNAYGLFKVKDKIYQVRGYDMANMTIIEGDTGWIIFDPLMSIECSQAAMQLVTKNLGERPIKAIIISHCHIDHYGGIKGIISEEDVADRKLSIEEQLNSNKIPIIVPQGFTEHAIEENVYVGKAMTRRANYQYGVPLEPGIIGKMSIGIGMGQSVGTLSFIAPTYEVTKTQEVLNIDGIELEFQLTPGTEAPAEMNTWFPQFNALWMAENCTGTLHNLYTLRGAEVRDASLWTKYITEAISLYGDKVEVVFQSHNWPHWGNEVVNEYLINTASVYKFIHDQTLTYINEGYTSNEISNMIKLPEQLEKFWYTRQYYGTLSHNSKAVYQKYMGWYDANPVNLNPLTLSESAKKWVEYMGDINEVLRKAKKDFDNGEYQWVAEVTNVIVFADPTNQAARLLCADALEQLGYQAESGAWRNAYLTAAMELRTGNTSVTAPQATPNGDAQKHMTATMIFDYMGILLDKNALSDKDFTIGFLLIDTQEQYTIQVKNGVILVYENTMLPNASLKIACAKNALLLLLQKNIEQFTKISIYNGDLEYLKLIVNNLEAAAIKAEDFNIIEP